MDPLIRPATLEDDEKIIAIYNRVHADLPPMHVEEYRVWLRRERHLPVVRYVAEVGGEVVASVDLGEATQYERPGVFELYLDVDVAQRGTGIGTRLYDLVARSIPEVGAQRVYNTIRESSPTALDFAERRGFRQTGRADRMSRLSVARANLDGFLGAEEEVRAKGIVIRTLEEIGTEDEGFMRALMNLEHETGTDIPNSEEDRPPRYEAWREEQLHGVGKSSRWFWIALDGERPVGEARLRLRGEASAMNGYTGVDRAYRGRGIARALKLKTIEWARENGIAFLYTGNDVDNVPILAINIALGYEALPASIELVKES